VLLNEGKGVFEDGEWISVPGAGNCAAVADFNKDGTRRWRCVSSLRRFPSSLGLQ
jgi:hypothetical protein